MTFSDGFSFKTLIGASSKIVGELFVEGSLRIDGDIDGNVQTTSNVFIGEGARIRGNVLAKSAVVGGIVQGNIFAQDGVKLLSTSAVLGDVITKKLQVEENVVLHGKCISLHDENSYNMAAKRYADENSIREKTQFETSYQKMNKNE